MKNRKENLEKFYELLNEVIKKFPKRTLASISRESLPEKGVYFFFEPGEIRQDGNSERVVRVGTHAVRTNSEAILFERLKLHKGSQDLSGNHRASVFRKLIGYSIIQKENMNFPNWGKQSGVGEQIRTSEKPLEKKVSEYIITLPFTVLEVPGPSSRNNDRAFIEKNTIALLSNFNRERIDCCSKNWLGRYSPKKICCSGLWNSQYVSNQKIEENFLDTFRKHLNIMGFW